MADTIRYLPIEKPHLAGVIRLCKAEGWSSYTKDPETTWRVLTAPGVTTVVAVEGEEVVGFAQMQSDGAIQAHLSLILVAKDRRRRGLATRLVAEAFAKSGGSRIDVIADDTQEFYRSFVHKEWSGFRIHPEREE